MLKHYTHIHCFNGHLPGEPQLASHSLDNNGFRSEFSSCPTKALKVKLVNGQNVRPSTLPTVSKHYSPTQKIMIDPFSCKLTETSMSASCNYELETIEVSMYF